MILSGIWTGLRWKERGGKHYATSGVLVAADLVGEPADKRARITSVTPAEGLTDAQLEVQRRVDDYLADDTQPRGVDFLVAARQLGREALEPLWEIVSPIRAEWLTSRRAA